MRVKVLADGVQRSKAMVQRHSIRLPVLQHLRVEGYTLFPGDPPGAGIDWNFQPGVTLIAGINGLGKTTLLTMILRALTGPYDLTSSGALNIGVTVPDAPVELKGGALNFFSQRVANRAADSSVSLSALFGEDLLTVTRRLNNLSLLGAQLNGHSMDLASSKDMRETSVQAALAELIGVGTFVDVLLLLHHVILFHEDRPGALWDSNAQRHVLRALFLEKSTANRVAQLVLG